MKKFLNKIMAKFGYYRRNKIGDLLTELMLESAKRGGEILETDSVIGVRVKISAKNWI